MIYPLLILALIINAVPSALAKLSFDFSQYFVGTIPCLMQFVSAPLSISAIKSFEKSSTTSVTFENQFWKVIVDCLIFDSSFGVLFVRSLVDFKLTTSFFKSL